jgi:penicillin-binding protein 1A
MNWFKSAIGHPSRNFWIAYSIIIVSVVVFFVCIAKGVFGPLPSLRDLENPQTAVATEVISADGVVLGKYFRENRTNVEFSHLPKCLVNALLATEDARFYDHTGIDMRALGRAISGMVTRDTKGGASTITQQLAKNLFPRKRNMPKWKLALQKFKEWVIAAKLERTFTKDEIIAHYFNTVPFNDGAYGISTAAQTYFSKPVDSLRVEEAAVLVGMLKASTEYNPRANPEASKKRRNVVIGQMYSYDYITKEQRDSLWALPLVVNFDAGTHVEGPAPYFREYLRLYLADYLETHLKPDGSKYDLYKDGLKIYTTINSQMQQYAEEAQKEHLEEWQKLFFKVAAKDPWKEFPEEWEKTYTQSIRYKQWKAQGKTREEIDELMDKAIPMKIFSWQGEKDTVMSPRDSIRYHRMILQNGFIAMEPESGYVRAWVGGDNYKYFQYDHVNINTKRQIGSTFKPFVYAAAIRDKGYSPCYEVPNELVTFEKDDPRFHLQDDWTPHNSDNKYGGSLNLKQGLANSVNCITAYLMHEMSAETVVKLVHAMGVKSNIPDQPSICLGTADISLIEMAGAYTTFINKGVHVEPVFMTRIEDRSGNVIASFTADRNEVLDEQTAYVMVDLLRGVVLYGTGVRLRYKYKLLGDLIGKTGTTQNNSDGWFIGCSPDLITATWVGCEDRFIRFRSMEYGQGASTALPICAKFFQKVYSDSTNLGYSPSAIFAKPEKLNIELNCKNYKGQKTDKSQDFGSEGNTDSDSTSTP